MIPREDFNNAREDPLAGKSRSFIQKINQEMKKELLGLCKEFGNMELSEVFIYAIDRLGLDVLGRNENEDWMAFRIPWHEPVSDISQCQKRFDELYQL